MTGTTALRLAMIIGSTREGRAGDTVGGWFAGHVTGRDDLRLEIVDLADFAFPASYPLRPTPTIARFVGLVGRADAFVVVTPEYNRSYPASLKQAIDYGYDEWHAKPVGFVSYGCQSEGRYAVEHLRSVFTELHAVTMRTTVSFNLLHGTFDVAGRPVGDTELDRAATTMLDQLSWWGTALRDARAARPYVA